MVDNPGAEVDVRMLLNVFKELVITVGWLQRDLVNGLKTG
jgi:hypothetical protein